MCQLPSSSAGRLSAAGCCRGSQPSRTGWAGASVTGFAWFASILSDAHNPVLFTAGQVLYHFYYARFLHLILSFPSGRLRGRLDRALIVVTIVLVAIINAAGLLFTDPQMLCPNCPARLLDVAREDTAMMGPTYLVRIGAIAADLRGALSRALGPLAGAGLLVPNRVPLRPMAGRLSWVGGRSPQRDPDRTGRPASRGGHPRSGAALQLCAGRLGLRGGRAVAGQRTARRRAARQACRAAGIAGAAGPDGRHRTAPGRAQPARRRAAAARLACPRLPGH